MLQDRNISTALSTVERSDDPAQIVGDTDKVLRADSITKFADGHSFDELCNQVISADAILEYSRGHYLGRGDLVASGQGFENLSLDSEVLPDRVVNLDDVGPV